MAYSIRRPDIVIKRLAAKKWLKHDVIKNIYYFSNIQCLIHLSGTISGPQVYVHVLSSPLYVGIDICMCVPLILSRKCK